MPMRSSVSRSNALMSSWSADCSRCRSRSTIADAMYSTVSQPLSKLRAAISRRIKSSGTGEPMPDDLMRRLIAARNFARGCDTVEYIASAMVDLDLHLLQSADQLDINAFERDTLDRIGMPDEIVMRHRPPHFGHVFSGGYYASAYYSYMWSEVLDADAFAAFEETGDIFNPEVAKKLQQHVLSAGGSRDPAELYVAFRGRLPTADALLKKRGFLDAA